MGKYGKSSRQVPPPTRPWDVHPIWRGIGCILFLISPVIAYIMADLLITYNLDQGWFAIPAELLRTFTIPLARYFPIGNISFQHFYAKLMLTALLLLLGFGAIMVLYALIYSLMGPKRYGPLDARPIRRKTRRSR